MSRALRRVLLVVGTLNREVAAACIAIAHDKKVLGTEESIAGLRVVDDEKVRIINMTSCPLPFREPRSPSFQLSSPSLSSRQEQPCSIRALFPCGVDAPESSAYSYPCYRGQQQAPLFNVCTKLSTGVWCIADIAKLWKNRAGRNISDCPKITQYFRVAP